MTLSRTYSCDGDVNITALGSFSVFTLVYMSPYIADDCPRIHSTSYLLSSNKAEQPSYLGMLPSRYSQMDSNNFHGTQG